MTGQATVTRRDQSVIVSWPGEEKRVYQLARLPDYFLRWQIATRERLYQRLESRDDVAFMPPHLPVLATWANGDAGRTVNLATKGVALLPAAKYLGESVELLENTLAQTEDLPREETLSRRLAVVRQIYSDLSRLDPYSLGGLEIFEGTSYGHLLQNPRAALLFVEQWPRYTSYQIDVVTEIVGGDDLRYRFLVAARKLFEGEKFHVFQKGYGKAYVFWVTNVREKTPRTKEWK
ncbi:MAG TPA: hypothetical protein ENK07_10665 [Bacteroidetes bacterium]|nr:hypothetical protein [Bacteroidota bacterium]